MRLAGIAKGGYYPTPKRCVELLSELISVYTPEHSMKQETLRIIDPCCGPGDACETLASKLSTKTRAGIRTYGVELEKERSEKAREQMDFALSSDIFQTTIANNSFHLLYLNPPYDFDQESKRVEHAFLLHCTRYLVDGGLLVFVVPRHRLAGSARYLAGNYNRLVCRRFPRPGVRRLRPGDAAGKTKVQTGTGPRVRGENTALVGRPAGSHQHPGRLTDEHNRPRSEHRYTCPPGRGRNSSSPFAAWTRYGPQKKRSGQVSGPTRPSGKAYGPPRTGKLNP